MYIQESSHVANDCYTGSRSKSQMVMEAHEAYPQCCQIIHLLQDYDIDPQVPETAENMIFLSMLFQAHIDNMNGKENDWINLFDDMRKMVQESE